MSDKGNKHCDEVEKEILARKWCVRIPKTDCESCNYGEARWSCPAILVDQPDRANCTRCALTASRMADAQMGLDAVPEN